MTTTIWTPLAIGAGGYLTGLDMAPDGTRVVRTDTYGAYRWDSVQWVQLVTAQSMPAPDNGLDPSTFNYQCEGVYEIALAPSSPTRIYMFYRGMIFRSNDSGAHWTRTSFARVSGCDPNDQGNNLGRTQGRRMAVDPANPDVVYAGTANNGLFRTLDGGTTWSKVSGVPNSSTSAGILVAFDDKSAVSGGKTQRILAASFGVGLFQSTNGGTGWGLITGAPLQCRHLVVRNGDVYHCGTEGINNGLLKRYKNNSWKTLPTDPGQPERTHSVDVDPDDPNRIVALGDGGFLSVSTDGGSTFTGWCYQMLQQGSDIPWHDWANDAYMSAGDCRFDPVVPNTLCHAWGIGYSETTPPDTQTSPTWKGISKGIEQLVANGVISPPGGVPLVFSWDRPIFRVEDPLVYPSKYGPNRDNAVILGAAADWASADPSTIVLIANVGNSDESSVSHDGGVTWTNFPSVPPGSSTQYLGGMIAASSHDNFVWIGAQDSKDVYYTKNGGTSWSKGLTVTGDGISHSCYVNRHVLCADRVTADTFYFYYNGSQNSDGAGNGSDGALAGMYKSSDGGRDWEKVYSGRLFDTVGNLAYSFGFFNAKLRSVPGQAGHLFFCSGGVDGSVVSELFRTTDGAVTWTAVPNVTEVMDVGFGAAAPGKDYPSIYICGFVGGIAATDYGIWRSDDNCATWVKLTDWPNGNIDAVKCISGDSNNYGRCYVGFLGSGWAYGRLDDDDGTIDPPDPEPEIPEVTITVKTKGEVKVIVDYTALLK